MVPVFVRHNCRLRTHGFHYGYGHTGGIDECEPYQILVLERQNTSVRSSWTYEVWVWCALRKVPHWLTRPKFFNSLAKARESARGMWNIWAWRGPGKPVASDPDFVREGVGERHDPQRVPSWNQVYDHADKDPVWFNVEVGDDIFSLLPVDLEETFRVKVSRSETLKSA